MGRTMALLGSGEFDAWHDEVDRWLLGHADGDGSALILPTASAQEGEEVFTGWGRRGLDHYARLGIPAEVLPVRAREDALREDLVARVRDASLVFASGGNPSYLATVLDGTPLWDVVRTRMLDGLAYAGCSAGVACLTEKTYDSDSDDLDQIWKRGLAATRRGVLFAPHWDIVDSWVPGARGFIQGATPPGGVLVALDEETAMMGDGSVWTVVGRQGIHVFRDDGGDNGRREDRDARWSSFHAGESFELDLFDRVDRVDRGSAVPLP